MDGNKLVLNVGLSYPVEIEQPEGITLAVENQNKIMVKGADKQLVGETAAKIRGTRIPILIRVRALNMIMKYCVSKKVRPAHSQERNRR